MKTISTEDAHIDFIDLVMTICAVMVAFYEATHGGTNRTILACTIVVADCIGLAWKRIDRRLAILHDALVGDGDDTEN